jgi:hypothetical protein
VSDTLLSHQQNQHDDLVFAVGMAVVRKASLAGAA